MEHYSPQEDDITSLDLWNKVLIERSAELQNRRRASFLVMFLKKKNICMFTCKQAILRA